MQASRVAGCILGFVVAAAAQDAAKVAVTFEKSYEAAFARAKAEKKPVLFCIMKDAEIACKRMLGNIYTDADVRRKMSEFVLVPCSVSAEPTFEGVAPVEHQACERAMRENFQAENLVIAPQHIIADPNGKVLTKKVYEITSAKKFIEFLDRGLLIFVDPAKAAGVESAPTGGDSRPTPDGKPAAKVRSPEVERLLTLIAKAPAAERERLVKDLLSEPDSEERQEAYLEVVQKTRDAKERGALIRAIGHPEFSPAAGTVVKLLEEKDAFPRNCAVVTLEEMANSVAIVPLLAVFKKDKDAEVKKDCLRAFGPCSAGNAEARDVLVKELASSNENHRCAAAMSLGFFVSAEESIQKALKARYPKETLKVKTAILWGLALSGDVEMAKLVQEMVADESNAQLKGLADAVRRQLGDATAPEAPAGGGGGGGGRKGGGGGGGGRRGGGGPGALRKALAPLYADDKIMRNRVKEFMDRGNGR